MNERMARCMLIIKVIVADGMISPNERAFLERAMEKMGLSDAERQTVMELHGWELAEPIVAKLPLEEKQALLEELTEAALVDGKLSAHETKTVQKIAEALGLGE